MRPRLWLWPNLLSLDAPIVALLWQLLFVRCFRAEVSPIPSILLAAAVWLIYAGDRMLDAWRGEAKHARHRFYALHWRGVLPVWCAVLLAGAWSAWEYAPTGLLERGAIIGAATALYLALVHATRRGLGRAKEAAVAVIFGLGASLAAWSQVATAADVAAIALFAAVCWTNCAAIEDWEHGRELRRSAVAAAAAVALCAAVFLRVERPIIGCAETACVLGLLLLDRWRDRLPSEGLRVLADAVLLTPLALLPVAGV